MSSFSHYLPTKTVNTLQDTSLLKETFELIVVVSITFHLKSLTTKRDLSGLHMPDEIL